VSSKSSTNTIESELFCSFCEASRLFFPASCFSYQYVHLTAHLCAIDNVSALSTTNERMSDLIQIYVERGIAESLGLGELVSEFARKPRKLLL
jgi:hypothetical protein